MEWSSEIYDIITWQYVNSGKPNNTLNTNDMHVDYVLFFIVFWCCIMICFWCMLYSSPINSWVVAHICTMNSLRPRRNGRHFPENIFIFLERKMYEFRLQFHWSLFLRVQFTIFQHRFKYWLCTDQATSPYLNQWWLEYRRIYASLGFSQLNWVVIGSGNVWSPDQRQAFI